MSIHESAILGDLPAATDDGPVFISDRRMKSVHKGSDEHRELLEIQKNKGIKVIRDIEFRSFLMRERKVSSTRDFKPKKGWYYLQDLMKGMSPLVVSNIAPIRDGSKSNNAILYISDEVLSPEGDQDLKDAHAQMIAGLENQAWSLHQETVLADINVIDFIRESAQEEVKAEEVVSTSTNRQAAFALIKSAVAEGASDVHINYYDDKPGQVFFRVSSLLTFETDITAQKLLPLMRALFQEGDCSDHPIGLNEQTIQDLDISLQLTDDITGKTTDYTLRWNSMPQDGGFKSVMRILENDPDKFAKLTFEMMGYTDHHQAVLRLGITTKVGFVLVVGTTGSGKSTTLVKSLLEMREMNPLWSYATVEDPIEYRIEGVTQHPLRLSYVESDGMNESQRKKAAFNKMLGALMRQDPDVISVGEIRDETTAMLVEDFVNTGHKIFATLHADSAMYSIDRLKGIGVEHETLTRPGFFSLIIYQTLVPRTCQHCSFKLDDERVSEEIRRKVTTALGNCTDNVRISNTDGCEKCGNRGVKGMSAACEMMIPDDVLCQELRNLDYVRAKKYWCNEQARPLPDAEFWGTTVADHLLYKIYQGNLCPVIAETESTEVFSRNELRTDLAKSIFEANRDQTTGADFCVAGAANA